MLVTFIKEIYGPLYDPRLALERHGYTVDLSFEKLVRLFDGRLRITRRKEDNEMFMMARVKPWKDCEKREKKPDKKDAYVGFPRRCNANVIAATALVYDIDNQEKWPVIDPQWFAQQYLGSLAVVASSASSKRDYPRGRVVAPISREITVEELSLIQGIILRRFMKHHPQYVSTKGETALDRSCRKASQPYYLPCHSENPFVLACEGAVFDVDNFLAGISANERKHIVGNPEQQRQGKPVSQTEENLMDCVRCLQAFSPDDEDDRWKSASALYKAFGDRAEPHWQEWYANATNWTEAKAAKKWSDAATSDSVHVGYLFNRLKTAQQTATNKAIVSTWGPAPDYIRARYQR